MNRAHRVRWSIFWLGALALVGVTAWTTALTLRLERDVHEARAVAARQDALRLALWRMDSWLAPLVAREGARPYFEYLPYYPPERAYTRMLQPLGLGEVLTPSPLLSSLPEYIRLHFQVDPYGVWSSPQVPTGNERDLAEATLDNGSEIVGCGEVLANLQQQAPTDELTVRLANLAGAMPPVDQLASDESEPAGQTAEVLQSDDAYNVQQELAYQQRRSTDELSKRWATNQVQRMAQSAEANQATMGVGAAVVSVGPMHALWLDVPAAVVLGAGTEGALGAEADDPLLVFVRRVDTPDGMAVQGWLADWPKLEAALLAEIHDLFPAADLEPHLAGEADERSLAAIPVSLVADGTDAAVFAMPAWTPARTVLVIAWACVLASIAAAALTLAAGVAFGERCRRFAWAVTHELRTPLTTFRMYSEMLVDGMIATEAQRRAYLQTLQQESNRLARLVENVLSYARAEDGRDAVRLERFTVGALFERIVPALECQAAEAGVALRVESNAPENTAVQVDVDAVARILTNLVDNACKYGAANQRADDGEREDAACDASEQRQACPVLITCAVDHPGRVAIGVCDRGPGIAAEHVARIFEPFDRGARVPGDTLPGLGLGLALSRALARHMHGDLALAASPEGGAWFKLILPVRSE